METQTCVQAMPIFQGGRLLKKKMLEALSNQAYFGINLLYKGYSDGVLSGCELYTTKNHIIMKEGILNYQGQLILISQPLSISYAPSNKTSYMKAKFLKTYQKADLICQEMCLTLSEKEQNQKDEINLCQFKLQEGAILRYEYQDFEDRNTEYDTIQTIQTPCAAYQTSTLMPEITAHFAKEMLEVQGLSALNTMFCMQLLNQEYPVSKQVLLTYLRCEWDMELTSSSNQEIYKGLVQALRNAKGMGTTEKKGNKKKWRMMVD